MGSRLMRWESSQKWRYVSPIDWAAAKGQVEVVKELLRMDPNLFRKLTSRKRNKKMESMWDEASCVEARKGRALVAKELLREDAYKIDVHGGWALFLAVAAADVTMVETLLAMKPDLAAGQGEYKSVDLLTAAAQAGNLQVLRLLVKHNIECKKNKEDLASTLHAAALGGEVDILREVLAEGYEFLDTLILSTNSHGATVLDAAASAGHLEIVNEILSTRPDIIHHRDNIGNTALHTAAQRGHVHVVEGLLKADKLLVVVTNDRGDTALHVAVYGPFHPPGEQGTQRALSVVKCLIAAKPDLVNYKNKDGRTPLHFAVGFAYSYSAEIVKTLLEAPGIEASAMDNEGMTALDIARASLVSEEVIEHLRSAGVSSGDLKIEDVTSVPGDNDDESSQGNNPVILRPPTRKGRPGSSVCSEAVVQSHGTGPSEIITMQPLFRLPTAQDVNIFQLPTQLEASTGLSSDRSRHPSRVHSRKLSISGSLKMEGQNRQIPVTQVPMHGLTRELSPSMSIITNPIGELNQISGGDQPDDSTDGRPASEIGTRNPASLRKSLSLTETAAQPVSRSTATVRRTSKLPLPPSEATALHNSLDHHEVKMESSVGKSYPLFMYEDMNDKKKDTVIQMPPSAPSTPSSRQSAGMFPDSAVKRGPPQVETPVGTSPSFHYAPDGQLDSFNKEMHRQRVHNAINTSTLVAAILAIINFVGMIAPLQEIRFPGQQAVLSGAADATHVSLYYIYYLFDALAFLTALFVILLLLIVVPVQAQAPESLLCKANKLVWVSALLTVVAFTSAVNISVRKHHGTLAWAISAIGALVFGVQFFLMLCTLAKFCTNHKSGKDSERLYHMVAGKDREKQHASPIYHLNSKMEWSEQSNSGTGGLGQ